MSCFRSSVLLLAFWCLASFLSQQAQAQVVHVAGTVQPDRTWGSGSGVTIYSGEGRSLHLTAWHVVNGPLSRVDDVLGKTIAYDKNLDVALIETKGEFKQVASLGEDYKAGDLIECIGRYGRPWKFRHSKGTALSAREGNYGSESGMSGGACGKDSVLRGIHLGRTTRTSADGRVEIVRKMLPVSEIKAFLEKEVPEFQCQNGFCIFRPYGRRPVQPLPVTSPVPPPPIDIPDIAKTARIQKLEQRVADLESQVAGSLSEIKSLQSQLRQLSAYQKGVTARIHVIFVTEDGEEIDLGTKEKKDGETVTIRLSQEVLETTTRDKES